MSAAAHRAADRIAGTRVIRWIAIATAAVVLQACSGTPAEPVERYAAEYVAIATAIATFDRDEVDAYFGPAELDRRSAEEPTTPAALLAQARQLATEIANDPQTTASARGKRLQVLVDDLVTLLDVLAATPPLPLAEEARRLYGLELPQTVDTSAHLQELDELLPGSGASLAFKLASWQNQLVIPADKRQAVFMRALEECKRRTAAHWPLPQNEQLTVELTREADSAWYRYEGDGRGKLQINPLAIAFVGTAIDVACHEGYPGHHAQFLLLENNASASGLPVEERVLLVRSPDSVLREGAANYGVELAWTPEERLAFERDVLFPLAGLPAAQAERASRIHRILTELGDATVPILRDYRDKAISFNTATFKLEREASVSGRALLEFVDRHGAYVVGYTVARERIADLIDEQARTSGDGPWAILQRLLAPPRANMLQSRRSPPTAEATRITEEKS